MSKDKRPRYEREQPRIVPSLSDNRLGVCPHCGKQHQPVYDHMHHAPVVAKRCEHQRGSVVLSLMLRGAIAGICLGWLALDGTDHPPPQIRPYPIEAGNDPDPPADPRWLARLRQRECMNEYRRQHRKVK